MLRNPSASALHQIRRALTRDPMLRDLLNEALPGLASDARFVPDVDVLQEDGRFVLIAELPGVPKDKVHVKVDGQKLIIYGDKPSRRNHDSSARSLERAVGPFRREFLLPQDANTEDVQANLEEGLLVVRVPLNHAGKPRDVEIG